LSESGNGHADAAADARTARGHALKDAESRVDQLQDNVHHLNQALRSQGEAARSAAAQGVDAIGRSIQDIAGAISTASEEAAAQADQADGVSQGAAGSSGAGTRAAGDPGSPASGSGTGGAQANAAAGRPAGGAEPAAGASGGAASAGAAASGAMASAAQAADSQAAERNQHRVSWLQDHLLGVMAGLLVLIVLIIAWLLRRANAARDMAESSPQVTEAMVRERIQDIDLNLQPGESRPPQA
jgi:pilus assembly protein FimV